MREEYPIKAKEDVVPVSDGASKVAAVGKDVTRVKTGDRVTVSCFENWIGGLCNPDYRSSSVGFSIDGILAEYTLFYEDAFNPIPDYISYAKAVSLPCAALTAWTVLNNIKPL